MHRVANDAKHAVHDKSRSGNPKLLQTICDQPNLPPKTTQKKIDYHIPVIIAVHPLYKYIHMDTKHTIVDTFTINYTKSSDFGATFR